MVFYFNPVTYSFFSKGNPIANQHTVNFRVPKNSAGSKQELFFEYKVIDTVILLNDILEVVRDHIIGLVYPVKPFIG
jgi:hypothetical protein